MDGNRIGDDFQKQTEYSRQKMSGGQLDWSKKPARYKAYPNAKRIPLPEPATDHGPGIWEIIHARRSERDYDPQKSMSKSQLSQLLWASQGITQKIPGHELRTAPSAGALYPVETYLVVNRIEEMEKGIYHYNVCEHLLEQISSGDFSEHVAEAALDQMMCQTAAVVFIWTAIFPRSKWKYRQRAYRYVYLDAGHIGHAVALAAVALDLGSCQIAALFDQEVNELIGCDGSDESVVYMTSVGHIL